MPPVIVGIKVIVAPAHTVVGPEIVPGDGNGLTVTDLVALAEPQILVAVYKIVSIPDDIPVTIAADAPDDATVALLLLALHAPPPVKSCIVIVVSGHTDVDPVILPGIGVPEVIAIVARDVHHALLTV